MALSIKAPFQTGVTDDLSYPERRLIVLSNYVAFILSCVNILLLVIIPQNHNLATLFETSVALVLFTIPFAFNHLHFHIFNRFYLSWLPPMLIAFHMITLMRQSESIPATTYDGFRFYILACGCIPYLLFGKNAPFKLALAILPSFLLLVFADTLFTWTGIGYHAVGIPDPGYSFTPIRAFMAYIIISGSCLALKILVEKGDDFNVKLLHELDLKNKILKTQARDELNKVNQELREREFKYRSLFEKAFDPILIINFSGLITDVNTGFIKLTGFQKEELVTRSILDFFDQRDADKFPLNHKNLQDEEHLYYETKVLKKDGSIVEVEVSVQTSGDNRILVIMRDLTDLRQAYKQLEESEARFRTAFEHSAIGMALVSFEGRFLKVNQQLSQITGYTVNELMDRKFQDITLPEELGPDMELFRETLEGKRSSYQREKRYIHKNGGVIWVNISVSLVRHNSGIPLYFVTQIENITDRKKAENELMEAETRFRTLVEKSLVGVYILKEGKYNYVNPAFADIFQYEPNEIVNELPIEALIYPEDHNLLYKNIDSRFNRKADSIRYEIRGVKSNNEVVWTEIFGSLIPYQGGEAIIGTLIDITERKSFEEKQALLSSIIISSDDAIISTSLDNNINSWNPGAARIFGYTEQEALGRTLAELTPHDLRKSNPGFFRAISTQSSIEQYETQWVRRDGEIIDVSLSISELRDDKGNNIGTSIIAQDVTYRVQAERAIRESEERYRVLVENATEALVVIDLGTGKFINVSESAVRLFKYSKEELFQLGPVSISPEYQPDGSRSEETAHIRLAEAVQQGASSFEWTHLDSTGRKIPCEIRLVLLPGEDKRQVRGSIVDISDRLQKEKELAEAQKKIGELKLMALRSVMSPHFIFNVLNSIQYYIIKNDRVNAINYLSTFSKLIRSVLTHSIDNKIKLSDELDILKNYIDLELARFENKFEYVLNVEEDIDTDSIEIPSLLLQPYIENAINHGLYNKQEKGLLVVNIFEEGNFIYFRIEDNGIGRQAAMELRKKNFPAHRSMGVKLTEERLRLINEEQRITFHIEDLKDGDQPAGTRVTIGMAF
ncbi:PAS domain S-box protein [Fulvivirga ulvae]|uniref:PAS domain S-box protein n=1 Tax=Fulvivirga ulvae TaxID=2904245 RepID=UPI001F459B43|nr:PAS domain S-box protein [Fulvivirga ulvae]UII31225.1 PAS domain S-box protein [Fulvivirga ulvae]